MRATPALALGLALALAGCGTWQPADPARIPDGPLQPSQNMAAPIGPIVELGRGQTAGVGWRYAAYRAADGLCLILETGSGGSSSCGPLPTDDSPFSGIGVAHGDFVTVDGVVASQVASVVIVTTDGRRVPARLLPLQPAGIDGQALLAVLPDAPRLRAALALDAQDGLIEAYDLSWAAP